MLEPRFQSFYLSHTERRFQPHPKKQWVEKDTHEKLISQWMTVYKTKDNASHASLVYLFIFNFQLIFFLLPFIVWLGICVNVCFMVSLHCAKVSCYGQQTFSENVSESEREKAWGKKTWSKIKIKYAFYACVLGSSSARYVVYRLSFVCFYWVSFQPNIVCVCLLL